MIGKQTFDWRAALQQLADPRAWVSPRHKRFWLLVAVLAYTLAGFFLVPWIAQRQIVAAIEKNLGRPAQVEQVRFNPYALSAEVRGLRVSEPDGAPLFGFDRFYVDFQLSSLFHWAWTFREIRLEGASSDLIRYADGDTNIGRMIAAIPAAPATDEPAPEPEPEADGRRVRLVIQSLAMVDFNADIRDDSRTPAFATHVGPVSLEAHNLSTLPEQTGTHQIVIDTEDGGRLAWGGSLQLSPLQSSGHIAASGAYVTVLSRYLQDAVNFTAGESKTTLNLDYQVGSHADGGIAVSVDQLELVLQDLALRANGDDTPFLQLPQLRLAGGHFEWPGKVVRAESLTLSGLDLRASRNAQGTLSLAQLVKAKAPAESKQDTAAVAAVSSVTESEPAAPMADWTLQLGSASLQEGRLRFVDKVPKTPASVTVSKIALTAKSLSNAAGAKFPLSLGLTLDSGGSVKADGTFSVLPQPTLDASIKGSDLAVAVIQPYASEFARVRIDGGALGFETQVAMPSIDALAVEGNLSFAGLDVRDAADGKRLLAWRQLAVDHYAYRMADNAFDVSEVALSAPYARVQVNADQTTNVQQLLVKRAEPAAANKSGDKDSGASTAVTIGKISLSKGSADFADRSLPLPFATHITQLEGEVSTLSTTSRNPAKLRLNGQVNDYGVARIQGKLTPFDPTVDTDIRVLFRNIEFPDLSPYTVKFAGRRIDSGRLEVSLQYRIEGGALKGDNSVVISDLQLGEKLDQPDAMNLPLGLAIALLKDSDGKIQVDLPVRGNIDDPQFELGGVIRNAIVQLITGVVTSPFRFLGSLVGMDSEQFDQIAFEPGLSEVPPPALEQLSKLTEALQKRPNLALEVPGAFVAAPDRAALQAQRVTAQIESAIEALRAGKSREQSRTVLQRKVVEELFHARFPDDSLKDLQAGFRRPPPDDPQGKPQLDESAYVSELQGRLEQAEAISDADLEALATARAQAVVAALTQSGAIAAGRVQIKAVETAELDQRGWVVVKLGVIKAPAP
ncbi:DUF748 domain-containing protein [Sinimarinibacterium sp. CAU 1509]|uniref:DUF748 domain-containing protein n=1 Tax=Sinimarinibacterium sp. CAU 1509 TaxID=2562283 RepID=UPI0010AD0B41|nr:DUF748 domain-containing protein [Sinimarinibacterium sp. CAU 1509]TJY62960.1 DUF748 domain-containing protein [Sinimarinibacterium sp. CAU 1509]